MVLLTGATGFVGRQVLHALIERKIHVRVVVREGKQELLPKSELLEIVQTYDLFAEPVQWWEQVCKGIDTVIHLAWYAEPGKYLQSPLNMDCLIGTFELAKGASLARVRRFVGIGTCFEYDVNKGTLSTDTPLLPLTPYAAAKASAYMMLSQFFQSLHIEFAWCRLFYLYGEGEDDRRLVASLHSKLSNKKKVKLTSGNQVRDFIDVRIAGEKITEAALGIKKGPLNICSGIPITVKEIAEKTADIYGRRDLLQFGVRAENIMDPPRVVGIPS